MLADKFRTNTDANKMASNSVLTENDVPGAKFVHPNIEEHTTKAGVCLPQGKDKILLKGKVINKFASAVWKNCLHYEILAPCVSNLD